MMTEKELGTLEHYHVTEDPVSQNIIDKCVGEIRRISAERDDLKRRLAVFTEGMPPTKTINKFLEYYRGKLFTADFGNPTVWVVTWLKRIASLDEKGETK